MDIIRLTWFRFLCDARIITYRMEHLVMDVVLLAGDAVLCRSSLSYGDHP